MFFVDYNGYKKEYSEFVYSMLFGFVIYQIHITFFNFDLNK